jgi:hypothetical protein
MSKWYLSLLTATLLIGCTPPSPAPRSSGAASTNAAPDAIDRLVARCEASQRSGSSHFPDGLFSPVALPASASPAELVSQALERQAGDAKPHTNFGILAVRPVHIGILEMAGIVDPNYIAVLIRTGAEKKIVLLQFQSPTRSWWNRVYDDE